MSSKGIGQEVHVEKVDRCHRCKSENVGMRFSNLLDEEYDEFRLYDNANKTFDVDEDDYKFHFDTYACYDCGEWDFYDDSTFAAGFEGVNHCPVCNEEKVLSTHVYDPWINQLILTCETCDTLFAIGQESRDSPLKIMNMKKKDASR